ncbi:hypothetical protein [Streptomyces sp. NPDC088789]|uniref:hypothetical protein n=1 Tax=Streptomyces sp. NPDC088789 TaxID=3365899 RepID=UPI003816B811
MSGYGSRRAVREVVIATLEKEGRNPNSYNIAGIMRDAFYDRGPGNGYGAESEEHWRKAVTEHRRTFGVGDMVRVVLEVDGHTEHHYGTIAQFRKANGGSYRGTPVKPHSAYVELMHHNGRTVPLAEVTPVIDDFEFIRDYAEVHKGAFGDLGVLWCMGCPRPYPMPAKVKVVHKATGEKTQLCDAHNDEEQWTQLGHRPMWSARTSRDTIESLIQNPEEITGPEDDWDARQLREWADLFPYLVPAKAAELHAQWKEKQSATLAA